MAYRTGHGKGKSASKRCDSTAATAPQGSTAAPHNNRIEGPDGTATDSAIAAATCLCETVALLPLPLAWERLPGATATALGVLLALPSNRTRDRAAIAEAVEVMSGTLVSRALADLGGQH